MNTIDRIKWDNLSQSQQRAMTQAMVQLAVYCGRYGEANRNSCLALVKRGLMSHITINTFELSEAGRELMFAINPKSRSEMDEKLQDYEPHEGDINTTDLLIGMIVQVREVPVMAEITRINRHFVWLEYDDGARGCVADSDCRELTLDEVADRYKKAHIMDTLNTAAEGLREVKVRLEETREPEYDPDPVEREHLNSTSYGNDDNSVSSADEMLQDELMADYETALKGNVEPDDSEVFRNDLIRATVAQSDRRLQENQALQDVNERLHNEIEKLQSDIVMLTAKNQKLQGDLKAAQAVIVDSGQQVEALKAEDKKFKEALNKAYWDAQPRFRLATLERVLMEYGVDLE